MARTYISVNGSNFVGEPGPSITINNPLVDGVPGTVASLVSVFGPDKMTYSMGSDAHYDVYLNSTLSNYLDINNMTWGQAGGINGMYNITSGTGNDTINFDRSGSGGGVATGSGNDVLNIKNSFIYRADMGAGNDEVAIYGNRSHLSQAELDAKAAAVGNDTTKMMAIDGGADSDTMLLGGGEWTVTLSRVVTIEYDTGDVVTNSFDYLSYSLVKFPNDGVTGSEVSFNGTIQFPDYQSGTVSYKSYAYFSNFEHMSLYCFTAGTMVETPQGLVPIESVREGDIVITRHGPKSLKWTGRRKLDVVDLAGNPKLAPVRIPKGAFGLGLPRQDVILSPQHRVVIRSKVSQTMFGSEEVMAPVKQLVGVNGIAADHGHDEVLYIHLMFDEHTTINIEGIEAETLYPGAQALKAVSDDARRELISIFPELARLAEGETEETVFEPVMPLLKGRNARALAARIVKNAKPFYMPHS